MKKVMWGLFVLLIVIALYGLAVKHDDVVAGFNRPQSSVRK